MTFLTLPRISPALALLLQDGDNIGPFDYSGHTWTPRGFAHQLRSRCRATLAEFDAFLDDPRLRKWFTFSAAVSHPKVVNLPLGLGSQRVVQKVLAMAREGSGTVLDIAEKEADVAITFSYDDVNTNHDYRETVTRHLKTRYHRMHEREREERKEITVLYANASALLPCRQSRWRNLSKDETAAACKEAKAVAYISTVAKAKTIPSPPGLGRDCFRTWEVLLMGGIPIVERRRFSHLYAGIPVIVVDSLITDVTPELIHSEYERLLRTTHWSHYQKLTVGYYQDLVRRSLGGDDGDVGGE